MLLLYTAAKSGENMGSQKRENVGECPQVLHYGWVQL
jgi:hypothetical protein